jgi:hypothetical protein
VPTIGLAALDDELDRLERAFAFARETGFADLVRGVQEEAAASVLPILERMCESDGPERFALSTRTPRF